jgi:hypothetical protein
MPNAGRLMVMSDSNTFSRSRHSVGTPNMRARDSILSIGTGARDREDDEEVLNEAVVARVEIDDEVSMLLPQGRVFLRNTLGREARLPREGFAEIHEVIGGRVDAAHRLEGGRVGYGDEYDEAAHRRGIESLRHALQRQRPSEFVAVPAG